MFATVMHEGLKIEEANPLAEFQASIDRPDELGRALVLQGAKTRQLKTIEND